ncbi:MAG TPA: hypothetical protein VNO82_16465 [Solirubrobacteraceae bacterium]|nr:hypothetical protein [Solirubrobacteraceae bacterium]
MIREQRLDPAVHYLEIRGPQPVEELGRRFDAALADGVRWLIVDLERAELAPEAETPLATVGCELRDRRGELILVSSAPEVSEAVARYEAAMRPAVASTVDQAITILKMLRPKSVLQAPRKWVTPLSLPRVEPPATA